MRILQVTPTIYSRHSVIGGGEKLVIYTDHALHRAAAAQQLEIVTSVLSFGVDPDHAIAERPIDYRIVPGTPWDAKSIDVSCLVNVLHDYETVYIDQCLSAVGMLVASHARMLGLRVVGRDSGGGEYPLVNTLPDVTRVYDAFHAQSVFAATGFSAFDVPVAVVLGPFDADNYRPPGKPHRDRRLVVAVGRVMPHKGFHRIVAALPESLSLVVVGQHYDADYIAELRALAQGKDVAFAGDLDDAALRDLLHRAGLFVHASTHYGRHGQFFAKPELLGLAPLEAIASGLPTLVSSAGALPELARLPGCQCFSDDRELAAMLRAHAEEAIDWPDEQSMHVGVDQTYGLLPSGSGLLTLLAAA